jgi:hypothetical protein
MTIKITKSGMTKTDVLKSLTLGIQQLSFEGKDSETYVAETRQVKDGIIVECVDGTIIELELKNLSNQ